MHQIFNFKLNQVTITISSKNTPGFLLIKSIPRRQLGPSPIERQLVGLFFHFSILKVVKGIYLKLILLSVTRGLHWNLRLLWVSWLENYLTTGWKRLSPYSLNSSLTLLPSEQDKYFPRWYLNSFWNRRKIKNTTQNLHASIFLPKSHDICPLPEMSGTACKHWIPTYFMSEISKNLSSR